jgi:putative acetyltransferase
MLIRREAPADAPVVHALTAAAFRKPDRPAGQVVPEAWLVDELRTCDAWIPALSMVAVGTDGDVIGHVLCTRGHVGEVPVLGLGPVSVRPDSQRRGVGSALVHAMLGAADALDEPLVALLGDPVYYSRFGFQLSDSYQIIPPQPQWQPHFQVRTLAAYQTGIRGAFRYPEPFDRV